MLGRNHSDETRRKMSESGKGKIFTKEHSRNMSIATKNRKRKPLSEETKRKIAESLKSKKDT